MPRGLVMFPLAAALMALEEFGTTGASWDEATLDSFLSILWRLCGGIRWRFAGSAAKPNGPTRSRS